MSNQRSEGSDNPIPLWCRALEVIASLGIPGITTLAQAGIRIYQVQHFTPHLSTTMAPRLFLTNDNGPNEVNFIQAELMPRGDYTRETAASILAIYNDLLMMLEGCKVGDLRLQNGLAAAVAGLSAREFYALPQETQESHRKEFVCKPIHRQLAPHLVVYHGTPRQYQRKPAISGRIRFQDTVVLDSEFYPWDSIWDSEDFSPTATGWITRSLDPQAHFIFLSGIFTAWPSRWANGSLSHYASYKSTLFLYLKVTLYHELAHYLRSLVCWFIFSVNLDSLWHFQAHGVCNNNSPEKCVDHPSKTHQDKDHSRSVGEGGRQAEAMAFGAVIDMGMSMSLPLLFCSYVTQASTDSENIPILLVSDLDQQEAPTYRIPLDIEGLLFNRLQKTAPLDLMAIGTQEPLHASLSGDSTYVIGKEVVANFVAPQGSKGKAKADTLPPSPDHSQVARLIPLTGEDLERFKAIRPHLDMVKGSCTSKD
jgi:hypothetical protein